MSCIDDPDISIRLQALELGAGMVDSESLVTVVERLIKQLQNAGLSNNLAGYARTGPVEIEPAADSEGEDPEERLQAQKQHTDDFPALPTEYRVIIIRKILDMCSKNTYCNIADFGWYLETLVQLVELSPSLGSSPTSPLDCDGYHNQDERQPAGQEIGYAIGRELRNVAVRVNSVRTKAVNAAAAMIGISGANASFSPIGARGAGVLGHAVWVIGEFANNLHDAYETLNSLIHPLVGSLPDKAVSAYLQAAPKVLVSIILRDGSSWSAERKTMIALLLARILHFLEPLTTHPSLDIQERAVELAELMRITAQAVSNQDKDVGYGPLLLMTVMPSLFTGYNLNAVAPTAQKKVPLPSELDLDTPLNQNLPTLLHLVDSEFPTELGYAEFEGFYNHRNGRKTNPNTALDAFPVAEPLTGSYQQAENLSMDLDVLDRNRVKDRSRNRDDPFYITSDEFSSGTSTPFHEILKTSNGADVDFDSIPIMSLDLGERGQGNSVSRLEVPKPNQKSLRTYVIADDENVEWEDSTDHQDSGPAKISTGKGPTTRKFDRGRKSLLEVDSSGLGRYSITGSELKMGQLDIERQEAEDADMARALKEVELLRLEMQRASERTEASNGIPPEGTLVRKRKKEKKRRRAKEQGDHTVSSEMEDTTSGMQSVNVKGVVLQADLAINTAPTSKPKKKKKPKAIPNLM